MVKAEINEAGKCVACGGELTLFGPRLNFEYHVCSSCETLQLFPMPTEKELEKAYASQYATAMQIEESNDPEWWKTAGQPYRKDILRALQNHNISGLIFDFGAGWGHLCEMLLENGFNCRGAELSSEMSTYCKKKGLPVKHGGFEVLETLDEKISTIVMCAVFEHLTDHHTWLRRFNRLLPVGGYVVTLHPTAACYTLIGKIIRFGNRRKELPDLHGAFGVPWHTAFFSLKAMGIVAEQEGFQLVEIRPASQGVTGGLIGLAQKCLQAVNHIGWKLAGLRWPLITTHVFVLRKTRDLS